MPAAQRIIGRYAIYDQIASGGMAVVHIGRMRGQVGFARTVAIKRLHSQFAKDPVFVDMLVDEARLAVRVQHPNVIAPLDVVMADSELFLVMEYVAGETLARLLRSSSETPEGVAPPIIACVMIGSLYGLHAAHEAKGEDGAPLNIVHRDVSPQNIIVGLDGVARVLDFGVAKAAMRSHCTTEGEVKGKLAYMAPEQVQLETLDRRTDVFAAGVVLWEALTGRRLFHADQPSMVLAKVLTYEIPPPSRYRRDVSPALDAVVAQALMRSREQRFQTAREFAIALERAVAPAGPHEVGEWVRQIGGLALAERAERVASIENHSSKMARLGVPARGSTPRMRASNPGAPLAAPTMVSTAARLSSPEATAQKGDHGRRLVAAPALRMPEAACERTCIEDVRPEDLRLGSHREAGTHEHASSQSAVWVARHPHVQAAISSRSRLLGAFAAGLALCAAVVVTWASRHGSSRLSAEGAGISPSSEHRAAPVRPGQQVAGSSTVPLPLASASKQTTVVDAGLAVAARSPTEALTDNPAAGRAKASPSPSQKLAQPPTSTASRPRVSHRAPAVVKPERAPREVQKTSCNPPYYLDAKGIRRLRPECL